ncbi:MAG: Na+/H+ antiporter subunit E [Desulfurococcaceae archaeon]
MKKLSSALALSLTLLVVYTAYTGRISSITLVTGLIISVTISLLLAKEQAVGVSFKPRSILKAIYLFKYSYHFLITEIKEHAEVAKIILGTETRIRPGLVEIPLEIESGTAMAILALTITNTPGTIAVHLDVNKKSMIVHWINVKVDDPSKAKEIIVGKFENLAKRVLEQ